MQIKTIKGHQSGNNRKQKTLIIGKDVEKSEPLYTADGDVKCCSAREDSLTIPQKQSGKSKVTT